MKNYAIFNSKNYFYRILLFTNSRLQTILVLVKSSDGPPKTSDISIIPILWLQLLEMEANLC